jgi:AraC-like DNA-binding protein
MQPSLHDVRSLLKNSIFVKELRLPHLDDQFHYHNAYEISYIIKSTGKRIVGDNIEDFTHDDLTLMAPYVPHITYTDRLFETRAEDHQVHAIVVYFYPDWLNEQHFNSPELSKIRTLLENMKRGIKVSGDTKVKVIKNVLKLRDTWGLKGIITLLDILLDISEADDYTCLASEGYTQLSNVKEEKRMNDIYQFITTHFKEKITLQEIASIANMTPTAFCKFFRNRTKKTFSNFVNEIRIGYACKLLMRKEVSISEVCFECGFNNVTNFNRYFKKLTKMVPTEYKLHFQNKE